MDRSWMKLMNRRSREYLDRVQQFMNFATNHAHLDGTISCLCKQCVHTNQWPIDVVRAHFVSKGFVGVITLRFLMGNHHLHKLLMKFLIVTSSKT